MLLLKMLLEEKLHDVVDQLTLDMAEVSHPGRLARRVHHYLITRKVMNILVRGRPLMRRRSQERLRVTIRENDIVWRESSHERHGGDRHDNLCLRVAKPAEDRMN